jgi:mannitol-1-phosphate/altronate dehydrogenase
MGDRVTRILLIGAGAIGRGYLPWVFKNEKAEFHFIDSNPDIIRKLNEQKTFKTHRVVDEVYETLNVKVASASLPQDFASNKQDYDLVFVSVGPRHIPKIASLVQNISAPIILCENDPLTVDTLKNLTGKKNVFFAVPDVITSNTAPQRLLQEDPLAISTEQGVLFIEEGAGPLPGDLSLISQDELLNKQWTAKLFLHNTPHCIAAYLGAIAGLQYVHEAMQVPEIDKIVSGSMQEMLNALKIRWDIPHSFLDWYAEKELSRFRCKLLFDPIARVAREPLRKLELDGRLIGAAQICLASGFIPENIMLGVASALLFDNPKDNDRHLAFMQRALSPASFLSHVLGLRPGEALEISLRQHLPEMFTKLRKISKTSNGVNA